MVHIALVGTRGVPARYGGFETAVEEVGRRLAARGHRVVVYSEVRCSGAPRRSSYLGMEVVAVPALRSRTTETLSRSLLAVLHSLRDRPDAAVVFNAANAPLLPLLRLQSIPVAVHVDGLEWQRGKWGPVGRQYYLTCEVLSVRWADELIADAEGIQHHYAQRYGAPSTLIVYGAPLIFGAAHELVEQVGFTPREYHLVVARMEPENHVDVIVRGYTESDAQFPLVVVGSSPYETPYVRAVRELAAADDRIHMLGAVWDQGLLNQLYANSLTYLHGHSVGGTNPSLLRAMGAGAPIVAWDVVFNREVAGEHGEYFSTPGHIAQAIEHAEHDPGPCEVRGQQGRERAKQRYDWDLVADGYEQLCRRLAGRSDP